jgi:hypothetical protein
MRLRLAEKADAVIGRISLGDKHIKKSRGKLIVPVELVEGEAAAQLRCGEHGIRRGERYRVAAASLCGLPRAGQGGDWGEVLLVTMERKPVGSGDRPLPL